MIEPFVEKQTREGVISYGLSSYGYDARVSREFKIFTNVDSAIVDPKAFSPASFVDRELVPFPKSDCSTSATEYPRAAASTAMPTPVAPPPMMAISNGVVRDVIFVSDSLRSIGTHLSCIVFIRVSNNDVEVTRFPPRPVLRERAGVRAFPADQLISFAGTPELARGFEREPTPTPAP